MSTISFILSIISGIFSGCALFLISRAIGKKDSADKQKEETRARESILILRSINAIGQLTLANSIALRDGKTDSNFSSALAEYSEVEKELYNYLLYVNANK